MNTPVSWYYVKKCPTWSSILVTKNREYCIIKISTDILSLKRLIFRLPKYQYTYHCQPLINLTMNDTIKHFPDFPNHYQNAMQQTLNSFSLFGILLLNPNQMIKINISHSLPCHQPLFFPEPDCWDDVNKKCLEVGLCPSPRGQSVDIVCSTTQKMTMMRMEKDRRALRFN